jgi:hypothetical protein
MRRRARSVRASVLGGIATALTGSAVLVGLGAGAAPSDLPDLVPQLPLGQTNVNDRWVDTHEIRGRTLFRFDTVINNFGSGAFEVYRDAAGTTYQRVWSGGDPLATGTPKAFPAGAPPAEDIPLAGGGIGQPNAMRYSDAFGHKHVHSQRIAAYDLLDRKGAVVREAAKNLAGFCLYDSWGPPRSGAPARYLDTYGDGGLPCAAGEPGYAGFLRMGIQRDWGDFYRSQLYDQWVDVTDVRPGTYRLRATVDPDGLYAESDEGDNVVVDPAVVIPGVVVRSRAVATPPGVALAVRLSGRVVGAGVKSRRTRCSDDQTRLASCMTTADPRALAFVVRRLPKGSGTVRVVHRRAIYRPPPGFTGTVRFTYTARDSRGLVSAPARVTVRVGGPRAAR